MKEKITSTIVSYSYDEIKKMKRPKNVWERFDAMTDDDIDYSDDAPSTEEELRQFKPSRFAKRLKQQRKPLVELDVLEWFSENFDDYRSEVNKVLKNYMEESIGNKNRLKSLSEKSTS